MARRHRHSGPVLEEGRPHSEESSRDIRFSCIEATGLARPLYEEASCRSWALPCEWLSVPWRRLEHHVVSEEDACQCALSVRLQSSPRGCRLPPKCKPWALEAATGGENDIIHPSGLGQAQG